MLEFRGGVSKKNNFQRGLCVIISIFSILRLLLKNKRYYFVIRLKHWRSIYANKPWRKLLRQEKKRLKERKTQLLIIHVFQLHEYKVYVF